MKSFNSCFVHFKQNRANDIIMEKWPILFSKGFGGWINRKLAQNTFQEWRMKSKIWKKTPSFLNRASGQCTHKNIFRYLLALPLMALSIPYVILESYTNSLPFVGFFFFVFRFFSSFYSVLFWISACFFLFTVYTRTIRVCGTRFV